MSPHPGPVHRRTPFAAALAAAALLLAGCAGGDGEALAGVDAAALVARAEQVLSETSSVSVRFAGTDVPPGAARLKSGSGVATDAPAFTGEVSVLMPDGPLTLDVVSVDGTVYTKLTAEPVFKPADPAGLGLNDPAGLLSSDTGLPRFVGDLADPTARERVTIDGESVITVTGTLPGELIDSTLTTADPSAPVDVTVSIVEGTGELRRAELTGPFYERGTDTRFVVVLDGYGKAVSVPRPPVAPAAVTP